MQRARCHKHFPTWRWNDVRAEREVKERFFDPFMALVRNPRLPGEGRAQLMRDGSLRGLLRRCPERDQLRERLRVSLAGLA